MRRELVLVLLTVLSMLAGCGGAGGARAAPEIAAGQYPPDFSVVLTVRAQQPGDTVVEQPAQYVLTPDRTLRVALGPGVRHELFPPASARLTPGQMAEVYAPVARYDLMAAADDEDAPRRDVFYEVTLKAKGQRQFCRTTPEDSPGMAELLRQLARLGGVE